MENMVYRAILPSMRRTDVISRLKQAEPALRALGVAGLYLFGSYAHDEATADSDVDVFVDPVSEDAFGFLRFMDAYQALERAFENRVDIGYSTREGLSRYVREDIEREALRIF